MLARVPVCLCARVPGTGSVAVFVALKPCVVTLLFLFAAVCANGVGYRNYDWSVAAPKSPTLVLLS